MRVLKPNDLFALAFVHDARLSPDGRRIAYVVSRTDEALDRESFELVIEELGVGAGRTPRFDGRISSPAWSPDGKRLAFIGTDAGSCRVYLVDEDLSVAALTAAGTTVQGPLAWSPDGATIAYATLELGHCDPSMRRISAKTYRCEGIGFVDQLRQNIHLADVASGSSRSLDLGLQISMQPVFSPCGKRLLFMGSATPVPYSVTILRGVKLLALEIESGRVTEILDDSWMMSSAAWTPDGERVVVAASRGSPLPIPTMGLWVVSRDGSNPQCRTRGAIGNVGLRVHHDMPTWGTARANILAPNAGAAYATVTTHGSGEIWRISLEGPVRCDAVVTGPRSCLITDATTSRLSYCASDLNVPWDLYTASLEGTDEKRHTALNENVLARWPSLRGEHLEFESADGTKLEGWHVSRADRSGPQPTVMFIHGGPYIAAGHAFRFDFHLLAANGYAVLFANFRGSAGYGEAFATGLLGDWGARGFPDHMAAVDAAIARGLADEKRLGVWGASHGGFATAWIVGHTNRFRAAVAESSNTNLATMYYLSDAPYLFEVELGGRPDEIPDVYRSRSPLTYAWRARTPTLMLHGEADLRCPITEAEQFYRALHDAGCETELVRIAGMNHMGDSTGPLSARRGQNEALLEWFERHL